VTNAVPKSIPRGHLLLAIGLSAFGLLAIVLAFHVGDLAQQVTRAGELLRKSGAGCAGQKTDIADVLDFLAMVARSMFAARRWLSSIGVLATLLPAVTSDTPKVIRIGSPLLGVLCFSFMLFGRGLH
jgi:hypothetical protein